MLAFMIAPLAVPCVFGLVSLAANLSDPGHGLFTFGFTLLFLPVAYLTELVFGVPAWKILRRFAVDSYSVFFATGACIGWLMARWYAGAWLTLMDVDFALAAAASATIFRWIVGPGVPRI